MQSGISDADHVESTETLLRNKSVTVQPNVEIFNPRDHLHTGLREEYKEMILHKKPANIPPDHLSKLVLGKMSRNTDDFINEKSDFAYDSEDYSAMRRSAYISS